MKDPVVLVTGGGGNLGRAVTAAFLERGARVAVPSYRTEHAAALDEARERYGDRLYTFMLDLTTERGAEQAIRQTVEWGGGLDSVAHLVGGFSGGALIADTTEAVWNRMMDLNLRSAWLISRFALAALLERGGGTLVFVSSRAAVRNRKKKGAYAIAKAGLLTLMETIAEEYGEQGIRANAVLPGTIDTEDNRRAMPKADTSVWTQPEEIARVITFLALPDSAPINGAALPVFGRS